ncbi:MAG: hypothetical protein ACKO34_03500 [Vampirovibrionales bacterium]
MMMTTLASPPVATVSQTPPAPKPSVATTAEATKTLPTADKQSTPPAVASSPTPSASSAPVSPQPTWVMLPNDAFTTSTPLLPLCPTGEPCPPMGVEISHSVGHQGNAVTAGMRGFVRGFNETLPIYAGIAATVGVFAEVANHLQKGRQIEQLKAGATEVYQQLSQALPEQQAHVQQQASNTKASLAGLTLERIKDELKLTGWNWKETAKEELNRRQTLANIYDVVANTLPTSTEQLKTNLKKELDQAHQFLETQRPSIGESLGKVLQFTASNGLGLAAITGVLVGGYRFLRQAEQNTNNRKEAVLQLQQERLNIEHDRTILAGADLSLKHGVLL